MFMNLLIAIFSHTYNRLQVEKEGVFLKQIIDIRPLMEYDDYYGILVFVPFPLNLIVVPFFPFIALMETKEFNDFLVSLFYHIVFIAYEGHFFLLLVPLRMIGMYVKCCLNKAYILFARDTG
eukprot:CAMPEP_0170567372 /NCGR_PEP_ID=MMETSP0211-20121228/80438_1 /TAXON_ID=311385 /ORGANISM="Pseudokeronopsis sp., Strain OXSARD2" /LENGTH=121 /DNA_ID=CAMNT_0010888809 /DNA_START=1650 /DNA_END=2015 /DNA_ORIENTATION=-